MEKKLERWIARRWEVRVVAIFTVLSLIAQQAGISSHHGQLSTWVGLVVIFASMAGTIMSILWTVIDWGEKPSRYYVPINRKLMSVAWWTFVFITFTIYAQGESNPWVWWVVLVQLAVTTRWMRTDRKRIPLWAGKLKQSAFKLTYHLSKLVLLIIVTVLECTIGPWVRLGESVAEAWQKTQSTWSTWTKTAWDRFDEVTEQIILKFI